MDEAQTGLAKLGTMWAFEQEGVVPDIFTISKHFGGGVAISAAITTDTIEEKASETGLVVGHSHSNDPMPCHAAIASIDIILEEVLTDVAQRIGAYWREHLERLASRHEIIGDIRGRGLVARHRTGHRPRHPRTGLRAGPRYWPPLPRKRPDNERAAERFRIPLRATLHHYRGANGRSRGDSGRGYCPFDIRSKALDSPGFLDES